MTGKTRPAKKTRPPKTGKTATKKTASQDKSEESPSSNDLLRKKLEGYEKKLAKYEKALGASKRNNVTLHEAYKKARKEIKALKKAAPQADSAELEELRHQVADLNELVEALRDDESNSELTLENVRLHEELLKVRKEYADANKTMARLMLRAQESETSLDALRQTASQASAKEVGQ
ncbi:MAG: hypothetical protein KC910_27365, partial [Candidatus Eremiobacteraeota bacterium]|nr:hypothetical protein [Candidatus Eremiobacteraeota bacterium]